MELTLQKLEVWRNASDGNQRYPVKTVEQAKNLINQLTDSDLANDAIIWNAFGLEVFADGEWSEWYDDDGNDILELMDMDEEDGDIPESFGTHQVNDIG